MATNRFHEKFAAASRRNDSLLCVGLDPDPDRIPPGVTPEEFLVAIVDATRDLVCCFKPNVAFFEPDLGDGIAALAAVRARIGTDLPVLIDAKRGDIGHTAGFYARAVFEGLDADAVTVSPYLGRDAVEPFLEYADRTSFVLVRTSNAGARDLQDLALASGEPLYEHVARLARDWHAERGNVGLVVGATYPAEGARIRGICPDQTILMPGVGAQEGDLAAAVRGAVDHRGDNLVVNASRAVLYAGADRGAASLSAWADAAREAADALREAINRARCP